MMIEHDHVHTAPGKIDNFPTRRCAAIDRDEKAGAMGVETTLQALAAQAITLFHPQRQKQFRRAAVRAQYLAKQRERSHPIDILIAEEHDLLMSFECRENSRNPRFSLRQEQRIPYRA